MKKNYEKNQLIISISFVFIILCSVFLINIFSYRYRSYKVTDSILISKNYLKLIVTSKDLEILKGSNYVLVDNKKIKYEIIDIERNILKRKVYYHNVIIKVKALNKYQDGDYVKITFFDRKRRLINIFKSFWKE